MFDANAFMSHVTQQPGVYRMLDESGKIIYVGKAKNLKKRLSSYFRKNLDSTKTKALVSQIANIEITVTSSENEALILENTLIKKHRPRYNVLFRDDKSYPYIYISTQHTFPRVTFHRGARRGKGKYYGPYPSVTAARESLNLLQKLFKVRQCRDSFYANRSRPCLQYQIKRCTAPCVGLIDAEQYASDVKHTQMFLEGKEQHVIEELAKRMDIAAAELDYETAAVYRDQMIKLRKVQEDQYVSGEKGEVDVIALAMQNNAACVQVLFIRGGHLLGNKGFFPVLPAGTSREDILAEFLPQYYLHNQHQQGLPREIIIAEKCPEQTWIANALCEQLQQPIKITTNVRSQRAQWVKLASKNAQLALASHIADKATNHQRLCALAEALQLDSIPQRLECFDISHSMGEATVASCVVFDSNGPVKADYRRYNIRDITPGDDYAAMQQALTRRYTKLKEGEAKLPDVLLIDGGKGQLSQAEKVLEELQVTGVTLIGVAKGEGRKPGLETLFCGDDKQGLQLESSSAALHIIQYIRDEAHRFAITGHRQQRDKKRKQSLLEGIPGVGSKRRQALLRHFGGMREVAQASVHELAKAPGISEAIAQTIYDHLHG